MTKHWSIEGSQTSYNAKGVEGFHPAYIKHTHPQTRALVTETTMAHADAEQSRLLALTGAQMAHEARVAWEAEQHKIDPYKERRGSLPIAVCTSTALAMIDCVPAWWAAEALGGGIYSTAVVAALLVVALAAGAGLAAFFKHKGWRRRFTAAVASMVGLIGLETALRFNYASVVSGTSFWRSALEALLLAVISGGLTILAYVLLERAESVFAWKRRLEVEEEERKARQLAELAEAAEANATHHGVALRHLSDGQLDNVTVLRGRMSSLVTPAGTDEAGEVAS
jgi:hypothetical protein